MSDYKKQSKRHESKMSDNTEPKKVKNYEEKAEVRKEKEKLSPIFHNKEVEKLDKEDAPHSIFDVYLLGAAAGSEAELQCAGILEAQLKEMTEKDLIDTFIQILERIQLENNTHSKDEQKEINYIRYLFTEHYHIFVRIYCAHIKELYPIMHKISERLALSDLPLFTDDPAVALYGSKKINGGNIRTYPPLKADQISKILDAQMLNGNIDLAQRWIRCIVEFSRELLCDPYYQERFATMQSELRMMVEENPRYRALLVSQLIENKGNLLLDLFEEYTKVYDLNKKLQEQKCEHEEKIKQLSALCEENQTELNRLQTKFDSLTKREMDKSAHIENLQEELEEFQERYQQQIGINEAIQREHSRKITEYQEEQERMILEEQEMDSELQNLQLKVDTLVTQNKNMESDLSSERSRTEKLREDMQSVRTEAVEKVIGDIVNTISDPINHFLEYFAYFDDIGEFDPDTLKLCQDDLGKLVQDLERFDVKTIGHRNQVVPFDRNLHLCEDHVENGDQVRIASVGWQVKDSVILKAQTEKEED